MIEVKMVACDLTHWVCAYSPEPTNGYAENTQTGMTPPPSLQLLSN